MASATLMVIGTDRAKRQWKPPREVIDAPHIELGPTTKLAARPTTSPRIAGCPPRSLIRGIQRGDALMTRREEECREQSGPKTRDCDRPKGSCDGTLWGS
jgi:hypothetical protein